jgi:hypothetical protein
MISPKGIKAVINRLLVRVAIKYQVAIFVNNLTKRIKKNSKADYKEFVV